MDKSYRTIRLPTRMIEFIEKFIQAHPECGYMSNAEFVKDAVRHQHCYLVHGVVFSIGKKVTCDEKEKQT